MRRNRPRPGPGFGDVVRADLGAGIVGVDELSVVSEVGRGEEEA